MPIVVAIETASDIPSIQKKDVVARFRRDGCSHCETSQDAWDTVCKIIDREYEDKQKAAVMEVESELESALGFQFPDGRPYSVSGYPTVSYFKQGIFQGEHNGGRSAEELVVHILNVLDLKKKPKKRTRRHKHKRRHSARKRRTHRSAHKHRSPHRHRSAHKHRSPHRHRSAHKHRSPHKHRSAHKHRSPHKHRSAHKHRSPHRHRRAPKQKKLEVIDLSQIMGRNR